MRRVICCLWLGVALSANVPDTVHAAGNPVMDALAQGSVVQWSGKEAVSQPFAFEVTIATNDKALNLGLAVGQPITITVAPGRVVSGMVERIEQVDGPGAQGLYRLQIVPGAKRLKYSSASRTFYGKSATEIASLLLGEGGVTNVEMRISTPAPLLEVAIQYQENNLAFLSRLVERAGIHYHIESSSGGDKIVFSDSNAGFLVSPIGKVLFSANAAPAVFSFVRGQSMYSGLVQAGDYNFETPALDLSAVAQSTQFGDLPERVFPASVDTKVEAQAVANLRMGAHLTEAQSCSGESTYPQLQAGQRVALTGHPRADFNQEYVITAVDHQKTGKDYRNTFGCVPAQVLYRSQQSTPLPVVAGVVSAIVVGPAGETKFVDKYGRVKVRFPWRLPEKSSFNDPGDAGFVRVAQIATGVGATAMWLPDVGDEVLVAFEHGDLHRPVVVGSLYNAKDMPPVALPANKHLSILRVQSDNGTKNELVVDPTAGNERVLIQSGQNTLTLGAGGIALQGTSITVNAGMDLVQRAGRAIVTEAGGDFSVKSGQSLTIASQKDAVVSIAGNTQLNNGGALRATVVGDAQLSFGSNWQVTVAGNTIVDSGRDVSVRAGQNLLLQTARAARLTAGDDAVIQTGKSLVTNSGAMFQFVAAQTGTIQAGDAMFTIRRDGNIEILGKDIAVKASGNLVTKGSKITQN